MEVHQLRYAVAVAEEASFTRAAARVHVAQPAVSQQIAQLEAELGERLFDRGDRRVRLTAAGEAFLPHARACLAAILEGRDAVRSLHGVLTGRLALGTVQSPPESVVELTGRFQREHPKVEITLRVGHSDELAAELAAGTLDAAVIGLGGQRLPAVIASRELATEPLVVVVADDHPLARHDSVDLAALDGQPILTLRRGSGLRTLLEASFARAGLTPRVQAETDDVLLLTDMARYGLGVALIPRSVAERAAGPVKLISLRPPSLRRQVVLAWHRQHASAAGRAFLAFAVPAADALAAAGRPPDAAPHAAPAGQPG